jgi:hypothetical protein
MTWAADSTDIDMRFTVIKKSIKCSWRYHRNWSPEVYWAEVQLGIVEPDVNLGCENRRGLRPDEEKSHDALANSDRYNAGILDFTRDWHGGAKR